MSGLSNLDAIGDTGVLTAGEAFTKGLGITDKIFVDNDSDDLEQSIPSTAWHRNVDLALIQADKEGMC